jgi:tRNA1(Val) A37 N6-methylase TrmN6
MTTTLDRVLDGRIRLLQPEKGYRVAIDPVMLAAAVPAQRGQSVLDLGCGVGAAMLCLAARVADLSCTGIEIQPELAQLAQENVAAHAALGEFSVLTGDLTAKPATLAHSAYDHVICNPPYFAAKAYAAAQSKKTVAHAMSGDHDWALWLSAAQRALKARGRLTMIVPPEALPVILTNLQGFGACEIFPLWPRAGTEAKRVILRAIKGSKAPMKLLAGLVLHEAEGNDYTPAAKAILRDAAALNF